jgi:predicted phosphate transport protein (TIGR00153 family)
VRFRSRPVDATFYDLFARSSAHLVEGATLLAEMFGDGADREALGERMRTAEHEADETTHQIIRRANSTTSVTPFDREDVYALASGLDDVMDHMEEALDLVVLYGVEDLPTELADQVEVLQRAADVTADAMPRLQSMRGLEEYWIEINRLENSGDKSYRRILAQLFGGEYDALEVLKLKDVVDSLEAAVDAFEAVAHTVERIAVKHS